MGNDTMASAGPRVRVVASPSSWIEGEAVRQLEAVANLPGMVDHAGMPDLHPGKGGPNGAAFLSSGLVRPSLVGSDVGCGIALWATDLKASRADPDRIAAALDGLDAPWEGDPATWLAERGLLPTAYDVALGTVGSGNHFLEIQAVHDIVDARAFAALGLDSARLTLLVHTGSRGLGESILRDHASRFGDGSLEEATEPFDSYMRRHDGAVAWAEANRDLVAHRVGCALGAAGQRVLDICHNGISRFERGGCTCWLHRKGAAPADRGAVVIPGSRGDFTWLVMPRPDRADALMSLAHGAGRKIARQAAKARLRGLHHKGDMKRNRWGGRLVCGNENLFTDYVFPAENGARHRPATETPFHRPNGSQAPQVGSPSFDHENQTLRLLMLLKKWVVDNVDKAFKLLICNDFRMSSMGVSL